MKTEMKVAIYQMIENMDSVVNGGKYDCFEKNLITVRALFNTSEFREPKVGEVWGCGNEYSVRTLHISDDEYPNLHGWMNLNTNMHCTGDVTLVHTFVAASLQEYYS